MSKARLAEPDLAQAFRPAAVQPSTWSEADRSFDVVWTTGAAVMRYDWWSDEEYEETLAVDPSAVRLERLQAGGPVLRDHVASTRTLLGSIVPGSVRIENGQGIARIRLAETAEAADIVALVRDGHLRTVSVGYNVHQYTRIERDRQLPQLRADDWEPLEISLTPVPADPGAQVRSKGKIPMPQPRILDEDGNPVQGRASDDTGAIYRGGNPNRARNVTEDQILRACSRANLPRDAERAMIEQHERSPMNETQLFDAVVEAVGAKRNAAPINSNREPGGGDSHIRHAFADALYARLTGTEPSERARPFAGASLVEMGRSLLERNGEPVRWLRPSAVVDQLTRGAQHTTSDFAFLVDNATRRFLIDTFSAIASPLKPLARPRTLTDFRPANAVKVEGPGGLRLVPESGEFKRTTMSEGSDSIRLHTYGEIFAISRQALINDDLGAFSDIARFFARAAAETEATYLASLINGDGVPLSDGVTLYHADHGNKAASGGAINETTLSAARIAMRNQKNLDGETFANVSPRYLVVGPAKETEAEKMLASISPATSDNSNPFAGRLDLVVDPRLVGNAWRLFADPMMHPVLHFATLEGQEGLYTDTRIGFDVDGVEFKARWDIGAAAWDYRGTYLNPGD
jgi:HK97 family phage prohead protease